MQIAVERGRSVKEDMKMGICGEHGEPESVAFATASASTTSPCSPSAACAPRGGAGFTQGVRHRGGRDGRLTGST